MKLAVIGSRLFNDRDALFAAIDRLSPSEVISGGARGADAMAEQYAADRGIPITVFHPDLDRYGSPAAFHVRNRAIITACDRVLACLAGPSKGTHATLRIAAKQAKPVDLIQS